MYFNKLNGEYTVEYDITSPELERIFTVHFSQPEFIFDAFPDIKLLLKRARVILFNSMAYIPNSETIRYLHLKKLENQKVPQ